MGASRHELQVAESKMEQSREGARLPKTPYVGHLVAEDTSAIAAPIAPVTSSTMIRGQKTGRKHGIAEAYSGSLN